MRRSCGNCESYGICSLAGEGGISYCELWIGWHDAKDELPEEGRDVLCICENEQGDHAQFVMWHDNVWIFQGHTVPCKVLAWRELPEYEVKDGKEEKT